MADEQKEQRTHEPTPKRKQEFRDEGRVTLSRDVASAAQLVVALLAFSTVGGAILDGLLEGATYSFSHSAAAGGAGPILAEAASGAFASVLFAAAPATIALMLILSLGATLALIAQIGFLWAPKALGFKASRLWQLGQVLGLRRVSIQLLLATFKVGLTGLVITLLIEAAMPLISSLSRRSVAATTKTLDLEIGQMLAVTAGILSALALLDYLNQRRQMMQQLRMTREELKRENEEQQGRPQIRQRRREAHRQLSANRLIDEVPRATVVVTNPTHYAVALRYDPATDHAPRVTARGTGPMALHIRRLARRHRVPIYENRPVARALWRVALGATVPAGLYQRVAEILAWVYRDRSGESQGRAR